MNATLPQLDRAQPLSAGHFRRVAERGFGGGFNSYPYSYAWFDEHLYIGTNRNALQVIVMTWPFEVPFECRPVPVPESHDELDLRGQIWRYHPPSQRWERVFRAPMVEGTEGRLVPMAVGFRSMVTFQASSDEKPVLYALPVVGRFAPSCAILRSVDGVNFHRVPPPCVEGETEDFASFRAVQAFKGRLWCSPSHSKGKRNTLRTDANVSSRVDVRFTDDPASGKWQISCPHAFGDPTNQSIIDMQACGNYLYVGTINFREGFQLWRTDGEGPAPHRWEKILDRGAERGQLNQAVLSMAEFHGDLFVGTCIQNGGQDRTNNIGPAAPEVLRVHPNGQWDIVCGYPRMTQQGFKIPISGLGPAFDNPLAGYIWRMCVHDGTIYVGTFDLSSFLPFMKRDEWPPHVQRVLDESTLDRFVRTRGGAELWRSTDGENWVPVTRNGFDNPYNFGVRALISTPAGMFVGFANPFGPKVAVKTASGWHYEQNPRGGVEIWHGAIEHAPQFDPETGLRYREITIAVPPPHVEHLGYDHLGIDPYSVESREAMFLADEVDTYSVEELQRSVWQASRFGPVLQLALADKDLVGLVESVEDEVSNYFGGSPFRNVGYWRREVDAPRQSAMRLLRELLALVPNLPNPRFAVIAAGGEIVAERLTKKYAAEAIQVVAEGDLLAKRRRRSIFSRSKSSAVPQLADLPDASVDILLWIEGPSRQSRPRGLAQANRILRAGGYLLTSELIGSRLADLANASSRDISFLSPLERYRQELAAAGFTPLQVLDITQAGWQRFYHHSRQFFLTKLLLQQIDQDRHSEILQALPGGELAVEAHLIVSAQKTNTRGDE